MIETKHWAEFGLETAVVPPTEIDFGNRVRTDYGDLDSLGDTFDIAGLINFVAVKRLHTPVSGFKYQLLAGGRRYWAMVKKGIKEIPVRVYPENTDEHTMKLIEKIENVSRKDFTWEEAVALDEEIHALQISKHGEKKGSAKMVGWTQKDTAKLLNKSEAGVSESLKMAQLLKEFPELSKCKTMAEARKVLRAMETKSSNTKKAAKLQVQQRGDLDVVRKKLCSSYIVSDVFAGLASLPNETFDLVEIDPPYGIDYDKLISKDGRVDKALFYNEVKPEEYEVFITKLISECCRVMKKNSWLILWYALDPWHDKMVNILEASALRPRGVPGIWDKSKGSVWAANPQKVLASASEFFLYASKGVPDLAMPGRGNVFSHASPPAAHRIHPTERPISLMTDILNTFVKPETTILSPFLGSGNTILAASNHTCTCVGFDLSQEYKDGFVLRVYDEKPGEYGTKKHKEN